ncbi:MAG: glutamine--fructose-6-phosphate transaminase (isomerizing) [Euryarchaeota archaeon]|nr:glutamine--fructose-6-phosphate transaminase (isomerizing) [Euryarchaeota archaeon]
MCGIFGYIGYQHSLPLLVEGLRRLEYRGYDSTGVGLYDGNTITVHKTVGKVNNLKQVLPEQANATMGIAHTRWATHGGVTQENTHPHASADGKVLLVHNGIIENYRPLRAKLIAKGVELQSETDSEVLAHMISLEMEKGSSPQESVRKMLKRVRGTWGLCVMFLGHDMLICARNGSPLIIGQGDGEMFVSSDPHPLTSHTQRVVYLEDGDMATITRTTIKVSSRQGRSIQTNVQTLEDSWAESELGDAPHYMYKEIYEQPDALRHCITGRVDREMGTGRLGGMRLAHSTLVQAPHVRLLGCGTAAHAAEIGQMLIEKMARIPAVTHIASEYRNNDPVINPKAIYLAVSQSGETADTISAIKEIKLKGGQVFGVVNVVGSTIARLCAQGVYIHSGPEQSVASTKAFTNMVGALTIFAMQLGRSRNLSKDQGRELIQQLQQAPHLMESYFEDIGPIDEAVDLLCDAKSVLYLGRGLSAPVAKEGALKLMELAYIPCLAYPAGEMKHGPMALLEDGSPVVVIAPSDHLKEKTLSAIHECKARGAKIILIHEKGDAIAEEGDISIPVPKIHPWLTPLLTVLPLQLMAYRTAVRLGKDVDRPRNLAKSVTVE